MRDLLLNLSETRENLLREYFIARGCRKGFDSCQNFRN